MGITVVEQARKTILTPETLKVRSRTGNHKGQELPSSTFKTALLSKRSIPEMKGRVKTGGEQGPVK